MSVRVSRTAQFPVRVSRTAIAKKSGTHNMKFMLNLLHHSEHDEKNSANI